jgi:hypothetical protein
MAQRRGILPGSAHSRITLAEGESGNIPTPDRERADPVMTPPNDTTKTPLPLSEAAVRKRRRPVAAILAADPHNNPMEPPKTPPIDQANPPLPLSAAPFGLGSFGSTAFGLGGLDSIASARAAPMDAQPSQTVELEGRASERAAGGGSLKGDAGVTPREGWRSGIEDPNLLSLARSLERMARDEIERLEGANDPEIIEGNSGQIELLTILADGFAKITVALEAVSENPNEPVLLGKAGEIVAGVSEGLNAWWEKNRAGIIDFGMEIALFATGVSLLGWAGADVKVATAAVVAMVLRNKK